MVACIYFFEMCLLEGSVIYYFYVVLNTLDTCEAAILKHFQWDKNEKKQFYA